MKRKFCLISILMLINTNILAEEWTSIIKDGDHEVFVDIDSYNVTDNLPYLIAKTNYKAPQHFKIPNKKIEYMTSIATFQFSCKEPLYRIRSIKLIDANNELINTVKISGGLQKLPLNSDEFSIGQLTCQVHQMLGGTNPAETKS